MAADTISGDDLGLIILILGILCLCGAAYMAYLRNVLGTVLLVFVAIVCFVLAT